MTKQNRAHDVGLGKKLTETQAGITTLEIAWWFYLGDYEAPSLPRVCAWLRVASVNRIVSLIEEASIRRDQPQPKVWVSRMIQREGRRA
jgi:hypothetical protein